jgi:hypothetical protein
MLFFPAFFIVVVVVTELSFFLVVDVDTVFDDDDDDDDDDDVGEKDTMYSSVFGFFCIKGSDDGDEDDGALSRFVIRSFCNKDVAVVPFRGSVLVRRNFFVGIAVTVGLTIVVVVVVVVAPVSVVVTVLFPSFGVALDFLQN